MIDGVRYINTREKIGRTWSTYVHSARLYSACRTGKRRAIPQARLEIFLREAPFRQGSL